MQAVECALLEGLLSAERLAPYRAACAGDLGAAIKLYHWNGELSAAFGTTLGDVEVIARNAMHRQLTAWSARTRGEERWYLNPAPAFLLPPAMDDIAKARSRATRNGRSETPGGVVAELNLGFWRYLLARRYDRGLWHPCLHRAFPGQPRATVFAAVDRLLDARNRIAHHEPMYNRPVPELFDTSLRVLAWIDPVARDWVDRRSRVPDVLAIRP